MLEATIALQLVIGEPHTAELVGIAHVESSGQHELMFAVRALAPVNFTIVIGIVAHAHIIGMTVP